MSHKLTPKQLKALYFIVEGMPVQQVARRLGVRRETISRWRHLPGFVDAYDQLMARTRRQLNHHAARVIGDALDGLRLQIRYQPPSSPYLLEIIRSLSTMTATTEENSTKP